MCEAMKPIEEMTLPELLTALNAALAAFEADYYAPTKSGKARARKVSVTLEKLLKRYRKVTIRPEA